MTTAHSRHHASQVDSTTREYINARINEELAPIRDDIEALRGALLSLRETANFNSGNLIGRLNNSGRTIVDVFYSHSAVKNIGE